MSVQAILPLRSRVLVSAAALASLVSMSAFADCPVNRVDYGCRDAIGISSLAPSLSWNQRLGDEPWQAGQVCPSACYDLPHGLLVGRAESDPWTPDCGASVNVEDLYEVAGVEPGTPLSFFADLQIEGTLSGTGAVWASLQEISPTGTGTSRLVTDPTPTFSLRLRLPLDHVAGEEFRINIDMSVSGNHPDGSIYATGLILFGGLPPGGYVRSCQRYQVQPVPTRLATWGQIKTTYR